MKQPTLLQSLTPIVILIGLIAVNLIIFGDDTLSGANQIALIFSSSIAALIAIYNGTKWDKIMNCVLETISSAMGAILILLMIGMLAGTWMASGVIPTMMYYGLNVINADLFLPTAVIASIIISVSVGSSWSTIATIGVALMGIGQALGFHDGMIAGAIISGAYFGDKLSPISDTSNLSAAVSKADLFVVIRYMLQTSIPAIIVTLIAFLLISIFSHTSGAVSDVSMFQEGLKSTYNISGWLLIVPVVTILGIAKKIPPLPVLLFGSILGGVAMAFFQPDVISALATDGANGLQSSYEVVIKTMFGSTQMNTPVAEINSLTSTKGMAGMLNTIWFIILAMSFGGILEAGGFLDKMTKAILSKVSTPRGVITATTGTGVLLNMTAGDQYLSIVLLGKMYAGPFEKFRLKEEVLARTLQDSAAVTSVLVPWNSCGAVQAAILGVSTFTYLPFAFFCYLSPLFSILFAWLDIKIRRKEEVSN